MVAPPKSKTGAAVVVATVVVASVVVVAAVVAAVVVAAVVAAVVVTAGGVLHAANKEKANSRHKISVIFLLSFPDIITIPPSFYF